jgi:hypothetical protein
MFAAGTITLKKLRRQGLNGRNIPSRSVVLAGFCGGNGDRMRMRTASGWVAAVLAIAGWRALAELLDRRAALRRSGVLERRLAARRELRVQRALAAAGLARTRRDVVHVAVHVGAVPPGDPDDVGLLEAAMRRAARDRIEVDERGGVRSSPRRTDWSALLAQSSGRVGDGDGARAPAWTIVLVATGVAFTLPALVRPLADAAPWLALAGGVLVLAGWLGSRGR